MRSPSIYVSVHHYHHHAHTHKHTCATATTRPKREIRLPFSPPPRKERKKESRIKTAGPVMARTGAGTYRLGRKRQTINNKHQVMSCLLASSPPPPRRRRRRRRLKPTTTRTMYTVCSARLDAHSHNSETTHPPPPTPAVTKQHNRSLHERGSYAHNSQPARPIRCGKETDRQSDRAWPAQPVFATSSFVVFLVWLAFSIAERARLGFEHRIHRSISAIMQSLFCHRNRRSPFLAWPHYTSTLVPCLCV